jgi:hypothetical protein
MRNVKMPGRVNVFKKAHPKGVFSMELGRNRDVDRSFSLHRGKQPASAVAPFRNAKLADQIALSRGVDLASFRPMCCKIFLLNQAEKNAAERPLIRMPVNPSTGPNWSANLRALRERRFHRRHLTSAIQPAQNRDDSMRLRPLLPPTSRAAR